MALTRFPDAPPRDHAAKLTSPDRIAALRSSQLLDSVPEEAFDRAVRLATRIVGAPISLVSLVDDTRQFFKAATGLPEEVAGSRGTPLSHSLCQYVVTNDTPLQVNDARAHPLLKDNGAVTDLGVTAYMGVPLHGPRGQVLGSFCAIDTAPRDWSEDDLSALRDIAASVEAEITLRHTLEQRELLVQELNHRVKNSFAVVQGIIAGSLRDKLPMDELVTSLRSRIQALSRAHELIVPVVNSDEGSGNELSMQNLVATLMEPHLRTSGEHVSIDGPAIMLGPRATTTLALAIHELTTNAAKYGALSSPDGWLEVTWLVRDDALHLDWTENGVPVEANAEMGEGFGTKLIGICIEAQLLGTITTEYRATGLHRAITLPLASLKT